MRIMFALCQKFTNEIVSVTSLVAILSRVSSLVQPTLLNFDWDPLEAKNTSNFVAPPLLYMTSAAVGPPPSFLIEGKWLNVFCDTEILYLLHFVFVLDSPSRCQTPRRRCLRSLGSRKLFPPTFHPSLLLLGSPPHMGPVGLLPLLAAGLILVVVVDVVKVLVRAG